MIMHLFEVETQSLLNLHPFLIVSQKDVQLPNATIHRFFSLSTLPPLSSLRWRRRTNSWICVVRRITIICVEDEKIASLQRCRFLLSTSFLCSQPMSQRLVHLAPISRTMFKLHSPGLEDICHFLSHNQYVVHEHAATFLQ